MENLLKNINITMLYKGDTATAATDVDCTGLIDMSGYESVMFISTITDVTGAISTGSYELVPRRSLVATSTTGLADLGSTCIAGLSGSLDTGDIGKAVVCDLVKTTARYYGVSIQKDGTGKSLAGPVIAIQYNPKKAPITQATGSVLEGVTLINPTT